MAAVLRRRPSPRVGDKSELRRHFRRLRRQSLAGVSPGLRRSARAELPRLLPPDRRLGLYWPVGSEPDLQPGDPGGWPACLPARLALPAVLPVAALAGLGVQGASSAEPAKPLGSCAGRASTAGSARDPQCLIYLPWSGQPPTGRDACGIPAPLPPPGLPLDPLAPEQLGLLLVPALAIDQTGIRLGSGGGWYDRLRADPAWRAVPALAVLPSACVCSQLPRDPWDIPFSGWLDERGVTWLEPPG